MGQALTLEDEPTLVRAVKAVKRSMAQDERLRDGYIVLMTSLFANIGSLIAWWIGRIQVGVCVGFIAVGVGRIGVSRGRLSRVIIGLGAIILGVGVGIPVSGLNIPRHPLVLRLYTPPVQSLLYRVTISLLVVIFTYDVSAIIQLKREKWKKLKAEEKKRQQRMRGIFYTPVKSKGKQGRSAISRGGGGGTGASNFSGLDRNVDIKSRNMFA